MIIISLNRRKRLKIGLITGFLAIIALVSVVYYAAVGERHMAAMKVYQPTSDFTLVVDAGHGGIDGGAVSVTGVPESIINLEIARKVEMLAVFYGIPVVMTRESEAVEYPSDAKSIRSKKVYDLKNRAKLVDGVDNAVLISIHQNMFADSSVSGPQIWYSSAIGSKELAEKTQVLMIDILQPDKHRVAAKVASNVYLMNNVKCPAVLVECGFISNYSDNELLQSDSYQVKIAVSLVASFSSSQDALRGGITSG